MKESGAWELMKWYHRAIYIVGYIYIAFAIFSFCVGLVIGSMGY